MADFDPTAYAAEPAAAPSPFDPESYAASPATSPGSPREMHMALADAAADRYQIPRPLFRGLIGAESNWNPQAVPRGPDGKPLSSAKGLTQLIDSTARDVGVTDPFDPAQSVEGGAKYLRRMHDQFGDWESAVAAYHDGPGNFAAHGASDDAEAYKQSVLHHAQADGGEASPAPAAPLLPPNQAALAAFKASNTTLSPDQGADALDLAQQHGLGPIFVAGSLPAVKQAAEQQQLKTTLAQAPVTASFMAQSPAHAAAAKDDADQLSTLEWIFGRDKQVPNPSPAAIAYAKANGMDPKAFTENEIPSALAAFYTKGIFSLRTAVLGLKAGTVGLNEPEKKDLAQAGEFAAAPVPGTEGHLGREMVGATVEALPQLAGFLGGGAASATFLLAQTYGSMHNQFSAQVKPDGTPKYTEAQVRGLAGAGSIATTAILGGVASRFTRGLVGKLLPKAAQAGVAEAGGSAVQKMLLASPALLDNLVGRSLEFTTHALNGIAFMVGQSVLNDLTDQTGDVLTGGEYDSSKTVQAAKRSVDGAMMLLPLMAAGPTLGLLHDTGRAWKAHADGLDIATQIEAAKDSRLIKRAPEQARVLLTAQAAKDPARATVHIPVEAFDKAMAAAGHEPAEAAQALVGDDGSAHQEAKATGGTLAVPMADVLVTLAPNGLADALLPDMKLDPEGMTIREAEPTVNALSMLLAEREILQMAPESPGRRAKLVELHLRMRDAAMDMPLNPLPTKGSGIEAKVPEAPHEEPAASLASGPDLQAQAIYDAENAKMLAAGRPDDEAHVFATLRAQNATAMATKYGGTPAEWYAKLGELNLHKGGDAQAGALDQKGPFDPNLLVQHNLTAGNLLHADELGGIPAPSIAISRKEHPLANFGEITLLGDKSLIDPKAGVPVFNADVYSARWPNSRFKMNEKELRSFAKEIAAHAKNLGTYLADIENEFSKDGIEGVLSRKQWEATLGSAFLKEKGQEVAPKMRPERMERDYSAQPALREFFEKRGVDLNFDHGGEYHRALSEAATRAIDEYAATLNKADPGLGDDVAESMRERDFSDGLIDFSDAHVLQRDAGKFGKTVADTHANEEEVLHRLNADPALNAEFQKWAKDKLSTLFGERYIEKYTDAGNRRRIAYTAENILRELTRKIRGAENFNYGLGTARSAGAKQFRSIEGIQAERGKIMSGEDFKAVKEEMGAKLEAVAHDLGGYHPNSSNFGYLDAIVGAVGDSYKRGWSMDRALRENGFQNVPREEVQKASAFAREVLAMPTEYFEAKPKRIVKLSEFKAAVAPDNTPQEALDVLKKHGVEVATYPRGNGEDGPRQAAIRSLAEKRNILFQADRPGPTWHSALENAAINAKQAKGTPESWLAVLSKTPGVKAEEIAETGVKGWLAEQKGTVSREDVAKYIREHRVELQEKVLGEPSSPAAADRMQTAHLAVLDKTADFERIAEAALAPPHAAARKAFIDAARAAGEDAGAAEADADRVARGSASPSDFSDSPTVAAAAAALHETSFTPVREMANSITRTSSYGAAGLGPSAPPEVVYAARALARASLDRRTIAAELDDANGKPHYESYTSGVHKPGTYRELLLTSPAAKDFSAPHFGEDSQGIIAHARIGETTDAQGRKVLMVEEIQSDLHQEGRSKGYKSNATPEEIATARAEFIKSALADGDSEKQATRNADKIQEGAWTAATWTPGPERDAALKFQEVAHGPEGAVANAPWKDTWEELMVRRLVRYAAEHGYERIALTPGSVHTERYGTEVIQWAVREGGALKPEDIEVTEDGGRWIAHTEDGRKRSYPKPAEHPDADEALAFREQAARDLGKERVFGVHAASQRGGHAGGIDIENEAARRGLLKEGGGERIANKEDLRSTLAAIGKENLTDKLWDRMQKEDSGVSRPRAEGFEQAYDKRLKGAFDKQLKKYGGKMELEDVFGRDTEAVGEAFDDSKKSQIPAHVADLPAALRDKVLAEGQPLFQAHLATAPTSEGRGFITFHPPGATGEPLKADLHFLTAADKSTGLHELSHFMLESLGRIAEQPDAHPDLKADYDQAIKELGYASHEERVAQGEERANLAAQATRTPEQDARLKELTGKEEKFSHLFETYLAEGKAPSPALRTVFGMLKQWMKDIYGAIRGISQQYERAFGHPLQLSQAMRGVFDRLFAEDQARGAKREQPPGFAAYGARVKEAKMQDDAYAAYAAGRIAKLKIGEIKPWLYERQAQLHAAKMTELAKKLEAGRQGLAKTKIITPQNQKGEAATYKLVEAQDLIPSHTPGGFGPNPAYPAGVQERDYLGDQGEQGKVMQGGAHINPALVLSDTPTAVDGPPMVTSGAKAYVLGGNGRSMMLHRAYAEGAPGEVYKEALRAKASAFGIAPEAVDAMKQPVLVRSVDAISSDSSKTEMIGAVRRFNEGLTQQLSPRLKAVAEAKVLTPQTVASIGELLGKGDASLRELLRSSPREFLTILERDGIVNNQNRAQYVTGGELTDEAKDKIEGMFLGRVMGSGQRLQATAPSMANKIERAVPSLLRVAGANPAFDEIGDVQGALDLINDAANRGLPLDDLLNQRTMFVEGRVEPRTVAMARMLEEKSGKDLGHRFKAWADAAAYDPRQPSMFGAPATPEEALSKLFAGQKDDLSGESRPADSSRKALTEGKPKGNFELTPQETKAKATKTAAAGEVQKTLSEVQQQHLIADHLAQAATRAKETAAKIKDFLTANAKDEKRAPIAKADYQMAQNVIGTRTPYTDGYDAILEKFFFRPRSGVPLTADPAIAQLEANDRLNFDPDSLRAILRAPPERQMGLGQTPRPSLDGLLLDEAKVVQAAIANIQKAARGAIEVVRNEQAATMVDDARKIVEFTANRPKRGLPSPSGAGKGALEGPLAKVAGAHAEMLKPEMILRNELGPVGEAYFAEFLKARARGEELQRTVGEQVAKAIDSMPSEMKETRFDAVDGPPSPKVDQAKWVRQDLMMLFAWAGNESNMARATGGLGVTEEQLHQTFDQLTKAEKDFVQSAIWDLNDKTLKPLLMAQTEKNTGTPMETIEARPITTKDGEYRGGFHHASYNREASQRAAARAVVDGVAGYYGDLKGNWASPAPAKGFTKSRVEGFSDVPNLDWSSYGAHVQAVIHYLAVDDFVKAFGAFLKHPATRGAMNDSIGPQKLKQLDEFAATVGRGKAEAPSVGALNLNRIVGTTFRSRVATAAFSMNLPVVAMQLSHLGVAEAALKIHPGHMLMGIGSALNPANWKAAHEASAQFGSGELGYRWNNYTDKTRAMLANIGPEGERTGRLLRAVTGGETPGAFQQKIRDASKSVYHWTDVASWAMYHTMDGFLSVSIWHAAKLKAIADGATPEEAVKAADQGVRDTMPTLNLAEGSALTRDRGTIGSLLLVRRFPNTIYNLAAMNAFQARTGVWDSSPGWNRAKAIAGGAAVAAGAYLGMTTSAHLLGGYLGGRGRQKDEGETNAQWVERRMLEGAFYPVPFGDEISTPFIEHFINGKPINRDAAMKSVRAAPTLALLIDEIAKAGEAMNKNKPIEDRLFAGSEVIMRARGIPVAPMKQARSIYDQATGKYRPQGAVDAADKLFYGPPRPKRPTNPLSDLSHALR